MTGHRRWRTPKAAQGELRAQFGRVDGELAIAYVWGGGGASSPDGRVLSTALEGAEVFDGRTLVEELAHRGYDITTLRFSVRRATDTHRTAETNEDSARGEA